MFVKKIVIMIVDHKQVVDTAHPILVNSNLLMFERKGFGEIHN